MRSKVTPRKVRVGLKRRRELNKERLGWRLAWWGSTEKKEASYLLGFRGRHQYSDERSNRIRALCLTFLLTASSTSAEHQALGWRLMRPKGIEDLAAFIVREVKRAAAEERERDEYYSAEEQ